MLNEKAVLETTIKELEERKATHWAQMQQIDFVRPLLQSRLDQINAGYKINEPDEETPS